MNNQLRRAVDAGSMNRFQWTAIAVCVVLNMVLGCLVWPLALPFCFSLQILDLDFQSFKSDSYRLNRFVWNSRIGEKNTFSTDDFLSPESAIDNSIIDVGTTWPLGLRTSNSP